MTAAAFLPTIVTVLLGLVFVVVFAFVAFLPLYCILDAASRPSATFRAAGSNKTLWVVLLIWLNLFAAVVYLSSVRPRLEATEILP